jgi:hypothetical protein
MIGKADVSCQEKKQFFYWGLFSGREREGVQDVGGIISEGNLLVQKY